ncbi:MAG: response regulator [Nostoc sp. S4]|nr:response regulator [Nostoc sp. S4]
MYFFYKIEDRWSILLIKLSSLHRKKSRVYLKRKSQSKSSSSNDLWLLVVDDNDDSLQLVILIFQEYQVRINTASSVDEAIKVIQKCQPDVLISDISMPNKDGYSLVSYIRSKEARKGGFIPAIALTGYLYPEYSKKALEAGFDKVISKPFDPDKLIASVAKLTQKSNKQLVKKLYIEQRCLSQGNYWQFAEQVQQLTNEIQLTWDNAQQLTDEVCLTTQKAQQLTKEIQLTCGKAQQIIEEAQQTREKVQQLRNSLL